jgi:Glycosyl transferase family 11
VLSKNPLQIVVRQISGLGNQLFQYAAGRYYSGLRGGDLRVATDLERRADSYGHPRPFLLSKFMITAPFKEITFTERLILSEDPRLRVAVSVASRLSRAQVLRESPAQRFRFVPDLPIRKDTRIAFLVGYWQVHQLVDSIGPAIRKEFILREEPQGKNLDTLKQIEDVDEPVSLHIRRGDYALAAEGNVVLPLDYYVRSIRIIQEHLRKPTFFVFSDEIAFARENLPKNIRAIFVDHNDAFQAHEDLRLMSHCHHHIIANSSLSWWGAWLNARPDKLVLAPKHWRVSRLSSYPDLLPHSWTLVDDVTNDEVVR